jgi:ketosteroid isomerase-like protein
MQENTMDFFAGVGNKCSFHVSLLVKECGREEQPVASKENACHVITTAYHTHHDRIGTNIVAHFGRASAAKVLTNERTQKVLTNEQTQIVDTVDTIFTALQTDDADKLNSVIAPGFYIFDGGKRFNAEQVMAIFKAQHLAGKRYEWNVTDIHISGNTAWIAYVNDGSISDASGRMHQQWLESGFLEKQAGTWKVVFMQSTRVPPPQENRK